MNDTKGTQQRQKRWNDEQIELFVGNLLRYGVILAAAVVILGGIPYLIRSGGHVADFSVFRPGPPMLTTVRGVVHGAFTGNAQAIIQLGLLLLIATPVARVMLSLLAFAEQRDRTYVVITAIVLVVLLWGLSGRGPA